MKAKGKEKFYGWIIVAGLFLLMAGPVAMIANMHPLFMGPVSEQLGISSTLFSINFMIVALVMGASSTIIGKFTGKVNIKFIIGISGLISGLAFASYGLAENIITFYIISVVIGITFAGTSQLSVSYIINNWFKEKKGLATGIVFSGVSLSSFIFMPVVAKYIEQFGYKKVYVVSGIIVAVIAVIVATFIIVDNPQKKGQYPLGQLKFENNKSNKNNIAVHGYTKQEAIKSNIFWIFILAMFILGVVSSGIQTHIPTSMVSSGHTATVAASIASFKAIFGLLGSLGLGIMLDKMNLKVSLILIGVAILSSIILLFASGNILAAYGFAAIHGFFMVIAGIGPTYLTSEIFGNKEYGSILGIVFFIFLIGGAVGPTLSSMIMDITGGYTTVWITYFVLTVITFVLLIYAVSKRKRQLVKNN